MPKDERTKQKRQLAYAVRRIDEAQQHLAPIWQQLRDDGRAWHELAGLPEPVYDPAEPERVLTGADVVSSLLEGLEEVKGGIGQVSLALWGAELDDLAKID